MLRRGVSLMEVLFAIGIISIGLLGVFATFPLALDQIGKGVVADRAARGGANAVATFTTHGLNRPDLWVWYTSSPITEEYATDFTSNASLLPDGSNSALWIDPQFVARNAGARSAAPGRDARLFPYYSRTASDHPRLRRITLADTYWSNSTNVRAMTGAVAETTFVVEDDLVFDLPEDRNATPLQVYGSQSTRRQYEGSMSWCATLIPEIDVTTSGATAGDLYKLAIVVFHRRNSSFAMDGLTERIVGVTDFYSAGLGGGDVELGASSADALELKRGDWLMLASTVHARTGSTDGVSLFSWYRVVETEDEARSVGGGVPWRRDVTLAGPDWPAQLLADPNPPGGPPNPGGLDRATFAFLVSDVVAVFERTINLETSSSWTY